MQFKVAFVCLLVVYSVSCRSIQRSGEDGNVNLVEFNMRGVIHGRCIFSAPGQEEISVLYEEKNGEISAKSVNPTVIDPVSQAITCRNAATQMPSDSLKARSGMVARPETNEELMVRYNDFANNIRSNEEYVAHLQPRFFSMLGSLVGSGLGISSTSGQNQNLGVSFGGDDSISDGIFPGFNLVDTNKNRFTSLGLKPHQNGFGDIFGNMFGK